MLSKEEIEYLSSQKDCITLELLTELRKTKEGKKEALEILDIPKDEEEYYLDAFDNRISFNGNRSLKKQYTKLKLSQIHIDELTRCYEDIRYFRDNYVQIKTPTTGISFPDMRPYQNNIIESLVDKDEQVIILSPRQCVSGSTLIQTEDGNITIEAYFHESKSELPSTDDLFELSRIPTRAIKCSSGFSIPLEVLKTRPLNMIRLEFSNGTYLECAENHTLITDTNTEIAANLALGKSIKCVDGAHKCTKVIDTHKKEHMYDVALVEDHLYWTNGILSHNSGKSITIATWLAWLYCFRKDLIMGICANKLKLACEFLKNTKDILTLLPMWMTPGVKVWNVSSIAADNGCRILTDAPSSDSYRGFSCNVIVVDECLDGSTEVEIKDPYSGVTRMVSMETLYKMTELRKKFSKNLTPDYIDYMLFWCEL